MELRRILFQDLAYMKIMEQEHWLHYEYPFNTELFTKYVEECKVRYEAVQEKMATAENSMDVEGINELLTYQHNNLTDKIDKLLKKRMEELAIDLNSKFVEIKTALDRNHEKASTIFNFVEHMSTFDFERHHSKNLSQDNVNSEENVNAQANDKRVLDTVPVITNQDENLPFYCSTPSINEVPICPQNFNSLQSVLDYYQ